MTLQKQPRKGNSSTRAAALIEVVVDVLLRLQKRTRFTRLMREHLWNRIANALQEKVQ
jgi:hypothetical protein